MNDIESYLESGEAVLGKERENDSVGDEVLAKGEGRVPYAQVQHGQAIHGEAGWQLDQVKVVELVAREIQKRR